MDNKKATNLVFFPVGTRANWAAKGIFMTPIILSPITNAMTQVSIYAYCKFANALPIYVNETPSKRRVKIIPSINQLIIPILLSALPGLLTE